MDMFQHVDASDITDEVDIDPSIAETIVAAAQRKLQLRDGVKPNESPVAAAEASPEEAPATSEEPVDIAPQEGETDPQ